MTAASAAPARVVVPSSARPRGGAARRGAALVPRAAEATQKAKPDWAGDDVLSKVVDAAINNKVLYEGLMKPMARRTLINTAEKNGVAWRDIAKARSSAAMPQPLSVTCIKRLPPSA